VRNLRNHRELLHDKPSIRKVLVLNSFQVIQFFIRKQSNVFANERVCHDCLVFQKKIRLLVRY